jgi:RNA polymerase sigma factor (sigma-70 family)
MDRNEIKWVSGAIAGDTDAFGMLVATHSPWLFARIASRLRSREVAEDLLQDALLAAFERLGELRDPSSFGPWLCSIVDNKVRMWHRRRIVQLSWLERLGAEPAAQIDREETRLGVVVREALARLTQAHRDVVVHYYLKGYTYQQTADLLEVGTDVVRSRLQKARRRLAKEMEEMAEPSSVHTYDLGVEDLEGLRCAAAFASVDPSREILRAICLDAGGRIIATDGSRLLDWMSPGLASLAAPAILAEVRADAIPDTDRATLLLGEEEATIKSPEGSGATFPLIPGPYVPYEKAVGTPGPIEVIAGSEELMSCVDELATDTGRRVGGPRIFHPRRGPRFAVCFRVF